MTAMRVASLRWILAGVGILGVLACERKPGADVAADSAAPTSIPPGPIATVDSLATPESAVHDSVGDFYLVSSINGGPSEKDNNGFITRIRPDGTIDSMKFIAGGRGGVTLHGPKGMAVRGDTLWVSDIDVVRMFDTRSGASLGLVDFHPHGAVFLNDVAAAPDGSIYITDSGLRFDASGMSHPGPDRVYRIAPDRRVSVVFDGETLARPNGITWDASSNRLLLGPLADSTVFAFAPGDSTLTPLAEGPGGYDGIEALGGGRFVVSSLDGSSVLLFENGVLRPVISGLTDPADIGLDRRRGRVLIPSLGGNRLLVYQLPR